MKKRLNISFFGSSLVSAYWNGAATYYRGIIKSLHEEGHDVTFFEPDIYDRQKNRDIDDPPWANVVVYEGTGEGARGAIAAAAESDVLIKTSGVGGFDDLLEKAVAETPQRGTLKIFWDVDAPATLNRVHSDIEDPFLKLIPKYDLILTYGGGEPVVNAYRSLGAVECVPIYNALDPDTHHPVQADPRFEADLGLLANRLPDRETRVERFFFDVASEMPDKRFLLGGSGWDDKEMPDNVNYVGHVYTRDHNAFNCTPLAVLNVNRDSMAEYGFSPPTRVFEAAGAGACLITDEWEGIEMFLEPGREVLVASDGSSVAEHLDELTKERSRTIGQAGLQRILSEHTYKHRVGELQELLQTKARGATV